MGKAKCFNSKPNLSDCFVNYSEIHFDKEWPPWAKIVTTLNPSGIHYIIRLIILTIYIDYMLSTANMPTSRPKLLRWSLIKFTRSFSFFTVLDLAQPVSLIEYFLCINSLNH